MAAWFRAYEGISTDAKFHLIARKSGQPVAFTLAVWLMLLDRASQATDRGSIEGFDCESADAVLGMPDGATQAIFDAMVAKGMIENGRIAKWEERQPKREDATSTERSREWRERKKAERDNDTQRNATPGNTTQQSATQCNDTQRNATPDKIRLEENIKEIKESSLRSDSFCAELSCDSAPPNEKPAEKPPSPPPVISLPLNTGELYPISEQEIAHLQELYPAVEVMQQLRHMLGWLEANPTKRKTKKGVMKFVNGWLAREQDKGGSPRASPPMQGGYPGQPAAPTEWQKERQETRLMAAALLAAREQRRSQNEQSGTQKLHAGTIDNSENRLQNRAIAE